MPFSRPVIAGLRKLQRYAQRVLNVPGRDAGALLRRAEGRGVQFDDKEPAPADALQISLERRKIDATRAQREEIGVLHLVAIGTGNMFRTAPVLRLRVF